MQSARAALPKITMTPKVMKAWRRAKYPNGAPRDAYEHIPLGYIIQKEAHPGSGHFAIWYVQGTSGFHFSTLREAKLWVENAIKEHKEFGTRTGRFSGVVNNITEIEREEKDASQAQTGPIPLET